MSRKTKGALVRGLIAAVTGQVNNDHAYVGKTVWSRRVNGQKQRKGVVTNTTACRLAGCTGCALSVLWDSGKRTYPCVKGCTTTESGDLEIA